MDTNGLTRTAPAHAKLKERKSPSRYRYRRRRIGATGVRPRAIRVRACLPRGAAGPHQGCDSVPFRSVPAVGADAAVRMRVTDVR
eukprot:4515729-Prymnesium_polylepis.1